MQIKFFYGTLRKGYYNYERFGGDKVFKPHSIHNNEYIVTGFKMYDNGSYPCVVYTGDKNDKITGEVYHIDDGLANRLYDMEIGAGYHQRTITIDDVDGKFDALMYVMYKEQVDNSRWEYIKNGKYANKNN